MGFDMSKKVLTFSPRTPHLPELTLPNAANLTDGLVRLDLVDNLYARVGFLRGSVFVGQAGKIMEGRLHYVEVGGYGFFACLSERAAAIRVMPIDGMTPTVTVARGKLTFVAAIVGMYPLGLKEIPEELEAVAN